MTATLAAELPALEVWEDEHGLRWYRDLERDLVGPSVTTVLRCIFGKPFPKEANDAAEFARKRGIEVHRAIAILCGVKPGFTLNWDSLDPVVRPRVESFQKWAYCAQWKPVLVEQALFSRRYRFGGTPDQVGHFAVGHTATVLDFKPLEAPLAGLQLAGYAILAKENLGFQFVERRALHLGDGIAQPRELGDHATERDVFLAALSCFNYGHRKGLWK